MPKLVHSSWFMVRSLLLVFFLLSTIYHLPSTSYARTTPEDIINTQRESYNERVKNYSPENQQRVLQASERVNSFNKEKTDYLGALMERQGEILDEYIARSGADPRFATDGIKRNLENDVENARYWLTFAHEAVAFQAAKAYIINLTGETSINGNINSTISTMEYDLNTLRGKVIKSQNIIKELVTSI